MKENLEHVSLGRLPADVMTSEQVDVPVGPVKLF